MEIDIPFEFQIQWKYLKFFWGLKQTVIYSKNFSSFGRKIIEEQALKYLMPFHKSLFNIETMLVIVTERSWVGNSGISIDILWISGDGIRCFLADLEAPA